MCRLDMLSSKNDYVIEGAISNLQQEPSVEVEIVDEVSDYGSTFQSFRSEDEDDPCLLETEKSEKKMTTSNAQEEASDQQPTMEKEEVSSETDDDSTIRSVFGDRWVPCLEIEEYDEGFVTFSRTSSSSTSFISSFSACQRKNTHTRKRNFFKSLLGLSIRKSTLTTKMQISYKDAVIRVFTKKELGKATNNYNWIIGNGVNGAVYKGILDDQRVVVVKKSRVVDSSMIHNYLKRISILSKIDHVNVVKLVGCCLEEEVPMLVYEYIPNGSLFELIHLKREHPVVFPLDIRLKMAAEVAEALAYLHSGASPILHGNVKSSNILLDEDYTTKVSDLGDLFSASNVEDRFVILVPGTRGYFDPEYLMTGELTDRSDVYSFGIVLLELLTRKKVFFFDFNFESHYLLQKFGVCTRENRLLDILDPEITREGLTERLQKVTDLAARCLEEKGSDRPTMKEVHRELEASTRSTTTLHRLPQ